MKGSSLNTVMAASFSFCLMACGSGSYKAAGNNTEANQAALANPSGAISENEKRDGWISLFDGKTLAGWRTYQNKPADSWTVQNGVLHCLGNTVDKKVQRADLITNEQFENFDLSIEWKISPQGNSGIHYMVTESEKSASTTGPEYQLIDDVNFPQKLEDWQKTGANYAMHTAPSAEPKPVGEWNHTRILVNKGRVEHWLNGKKIVEYELWTDDWKARKESGKWKDAPNYGAAKRGHIALQDHASEAWFRNIKIKQL